MSRRIDHVEHGWPEATGRRRVLVENPDLSAFELRTQVLREAGYDVAMCAGPQDAVHERGADTAWGSETRFAVGERHRHGHR